MLSTEDRDSLIGCFGVDVPDGADDTGLIPGFIHPSITCISGQPEVGKSTLLLGMLRALFDGGDFAGVPTNLPPGKAIALGCEDAPAVRRVRRAFPDECAAGRLIVFQVAPGAAGTFKQDWADTIGLVVIDSVLAAVGDVNDQAVTAATTAKWRALQVPVLVVHHEARSGPRGPSGAQAWRAAYRLTLDVRQQSGTAEALVLKIRASGNDIEVRHDVLRVDRQTFAVSVADNAAAAKLGRSDGEVAGRIRQALSEAGVRIEAGESPSAARGKLEAALAGRDGRTVFGVGVDTLRRDHLKRAEFRALVDAKPGT